MGTAAPTTNESQRLRAIVDTQAAINEAEPSAAEVMQMVAERSQELTHADGAVVELAEGDEMVYRAATGTVAGHLGLRLAIASSLSGQCVLTGHVMRCDDSETDDRVDHEACRRIGARSMIVVPLQRKDEVVGVLKVIAARPQAFGDDEVELLEVMAGFIAAAVSRAARFDAEARSARSDALTGLGNRAFLLDRLAEALGRASRSGTAVGLVYLDLDRFKPINDTHGHAAGDVVLKAVADRVSATLRTGDIVARIGGDEFVVLCEGASPATLHAVVERLGRAIAGPITIDPVDHEHGHHGHHGGPVVVDVGGSFGITLSSAGDDPATLLARADEAMYATKASHRATDVA
jgi:diguanylate cyclase (GGDEF)-like protein